jgi:hypothetical protein
MYDKLQLFEERGWLCACGCGKRAEHAHHCLLPDLKRFKTYVNTPLNIALVNGAEHTELKKFDNQEWRKEFYKQNVIRYGQPAMDKWIAKCPAKLRYRIDWL